MMIGAFQSMKIMKLQAKWEQRKQNPAKPPNGEEEAFRKEQNFRMEMERAQHAQVLGELDSKLRSGIALTNEEMEYLRRTSPDMYRDAVEANAERKAYQQMLKNCRSKEEVEELHRMKLDQFSSASKSISQNAVLSVPEKNKALTRIQYRMGAVEHTHRQFIRSQQYEKLPAQDRRKKKKVHSRTATVDGATQQSLMEQQKKEIAAPKTEHPSLVYSSRGETVSQTVQTESTRKLGEKA